MAAPKLTPARVLGYATRTPVLIANVVLVLARVGASYLPVYGRALHFLLWLATYRYAYAILNSTAEGHAEPPEGANVVEQGLTRRHTLLQTLLLVAVLWAGAAYGAFGTFVAILLVGALLPGAAIALTVAQNLVAALNPLSWLIVARRLGGLYVLLALGGALVATAQVLAGPTIEAIEPRALAIVVYYALVDALVFVYFHALGLALRAHAGALEYTVPSATLPPLRMRQEDNETLAETRSALRRGDDPAALTKLAHAVQQGAGLDVNARYRELLLRNGDTRALVEHARRYACQLLAAGDAPAALALVQDSLARDIAYVPADEHDTMRLIEAALDKRLADVAVVLTRNVAGVRPKWKELPALAQRVAERVGAWPGHLREAVGLLEEVGARLPPGQGRDAVEIAHRRLAQRLAGGAPV